MSAQIWLVRELKELTQPFAIGSHSIIDAAHEELFVWMRPTRGSYIVDVCVCVCVCVCLPCHPDEAPRFALSRDWDTYCLFGVN